MKLRLLCAGTLLLGASLLGACGQDSERGRCDRRQRAASTGGGRHHYLLRRHQ